MGKLFGIVFLVLVLLSFAVKAYIPDQQSRVPVIYWVADPAQQRHLEEFNRWLIVNGHVTSDGQPVVDARIENSDLDVFKLLIQGVSGDCGDIVEGSGMAIQYLQQAGLLKDLTVPAKSMGFDLNHTYAALKPELVIDGHQYAFPVLVYAFTYLANNDTFGKYGLPPPPMRWNIEEFEKIGKHFVDAANPPGMPRRYFFANEVRPIYLWRSFGLSMFNETMTRCTLDDPRYVRCLELLHKWAYEDHIIPTAADLQSVANKSAAQFGDSRIQMFSTGRYAMIFVGRHALPQLRAYGNLHMSVVEPPNGGFPNTGVGATDVAIYAGSRHADLAEYFLEFAASSDFSQDIVVSADGIPPNPATTTTTAYLRPPEHPNEWGMHAAFVNILNDIGIEDPFSPYVMTFTAYLMEEDARQRYMSGLCTAQEAARIASDRINTEIQRTLEESPSLRERYEREIALQGQIDELRAHGKLVPLSWVSNSFYRKYYQYEGWADPSK
jgi:multiple sugar transport system substrate-binding protein